jgi:hypothetical protein
VATVKGVDARFLGCLLAAGCGNLGGLGGPVPPLVTFQVEANGDLVRPPGITSERSLQVALVWGAQWWTEPFCILPPESPSVAAVIAAGCRDPFGFVPSLVAASVPVEIGTPSSLSLLNPPPTDVLVGAVTSRVGYASLVLYDDRDGSGTLDLSSPHPTPFGGDGPPEDDSADSGDIVYGASFVTMTAPDQRVLYLQGTFDETSAFYPRSGCPDPGSQPSLFTNGFTVLGAQGFSAADGLSASAAGTLPTETPPCTMGLPDATLVSIATQAPPDVNEVSCTERSLDGTTRYREPPTDAPDLTDRASACAMLPSFDAGDQTNLIQLVVSGRSTDHCKGLTHYTLRGCRENVACALPDWDFTANPPAWWPCPN